MSRNRAAVWLLLCAVPVWAVGLHHSLNVRRAQIEPRGAHAWLARYAKLRPHLEGTPEAVIVYDPGGGRQSNKRLFRAQYVLAPTAVNLPRRQPPPVRPRKMPLIFDFRDHDALDELLARMAAKARRNGVHMETARVARGLAVVWMTEE